MIYPTLTAKSGYQDTVEQFRGYNHNLRIGSGEFYNMQNMSSDNYPVLSPRKARGWYAKPASPQGLIAKEKLCYVDGTDFVIGEERIPMGLSTAKKDCPKQLISMGAFVIIMPDKKYIDTADLTDYGDIDAEYISTGEVSFLLSDIDGEAIENVTVADTAPEEPENLQYWLDTSEKPSVLKRWAETTSQWVSATSTYVKITAAGIGKPFQQYDGVTISGITAAGLEELNATMTIWAKGDDFLVVTGILSGGETQEGAITVGRKMPNMDFVVESNNRLWGCRYGEALNGEMVNEIYASKLGDFRNWNSFMGISTDSYAASCGSDGPFTGAITLGYPLFFKEKCFHKVYGSIPSNFQIQKTDCRGVQSGCGRSMAIVNETLYYKARSGICAYDGSLPREVSSDLGTGLYSDAVGGSHGNKYYVSMRGDEGWELFVYDTEKAMWHREDDLHASDFASFQGELYCVDAEDNNIITMGGSGEAYEDTVEWNAETGDLGLSYPEKKYISRMVIRLSVEAKSTVDIYIQYDRDGEWLHMAHVMGMELKGISVPIRPRRCDHMKLRFEGVGPGKVYSITKTIEKGSNL